jgi:twitching motility two-component system response regulator PilH
MVRVLVVDDSPTETEAFRSVLERHGHEVINATNGADGVAVASQEQPDVVLMDIVMPGLNGFQATRQLTRRADTKHIPVIIVTTKDQETDRVWGKRQGASGYLVKPINESRLLAEIESVMVIE